MKHAQRIVELEVRIMRLESVIEGFVIGVNQANSFNPMCGQCGNNPLYVGECHQSMCPHGLNPEQAEGM